MNKAMMTAIVALVIGAVLGFFGGKIYGQGKAPAQGSTRQAQGAGRQGGQGRFAGGGRVVGQIISADGKSITVKLMDGSSKIVLVPDSAVVSKTDTASKDDLKTGVTVAVFGTNNSDGSVTASDIQLNPMMRAAGGQGSPNPQSGTK